MESSPLASPFLNRNKGPWRVEDLVSPLEKPKQSHDEVHFTLTLHSSSSPQQENVIPRILGHCDMCLIDETPLWRGGPNGPKTLCNACGLRYSKELRKVKLVLGDKASAGDAAALPKTKKPKKPKSAAKKTQH